MDGWSNWKCLSYPITFKLLGSIMQQDNNVYADDIQLFSFVLESCPAWVTWPVNCPLFSSATCHNPHSPHTHTFIHSQALTTRCASPWRASRLIIFYTCARLKDCVCSRPRCVWGKMSEESSRGVSEIHRSCSHSSWLAAGPASLKKNKKK